VRHRPLGREPNTATSFGPTSRFCKIRLLNELERNYVYANVLKENHPLAHVFASGEPVFLPTITNAEAKLFATDDRHLEILNQLGFSSLVILPLLARGKLLGTVAFLRGATAVLILMKTFSWSKNSLNVLHFRLIMPGFIETRKMR